MTLPAWVRNRDGRLVQFDPDKISRALFAAAESLGRPDAFLVRELADGVVHFLSGESTEQSVTTIQIDEIVIKTVRELGHPVLAEAFAAWAAAKDRSYPIDATTPGSAELRQLSIPLSNDLTGERLVRDCLRAYSLQEVYSRDLAAAQRDGLLTLTGLEAPFELAAGVLPHDGDVFEAVCVARTRVGEFVLLDGPEYLLASRPDELPRYVHRLSLALQSLALYGLVNLNCAVPPTWATNATAGPLFAGSSSSEPQRKPKSLASDFLNTVLAAEKYASRIRIAWHVSEEDIREDHSEVLRHVARRALEGCPISFVLDRPGVSFVQIATVLHRDDPALLLAVQLHLPELANQVAGQADSAARFLQKLGSAVRLALSAGIQKREFLRRRGTDAEFLARGFLLDRAILSLSPAGLDAVVRSLLGCSLFENADGLEFARRVVDRLHDEVYEDGRTRHLAVMLDASCLLTGAAENGAAADLKSQLRVAADLGSVADLGSTTLHISECSASAASELAESLRWLWKRSEVDYVQLACPYAHSRQLVFSS